MKIKKDNFIKITIYIFSILVVIFLIGIGINTLYPETLAISDSINIASIFFNVLLTLFIIYLTMTESFRISNDEYNSIKKQAFIIDQEVSKIYEIFYYILMQPKSNKKIIVRYYITDDWRTNLSTLIPFLPQDVITDLYRLYSFCEYSNETGINYHDYKNFLQIKSHVATNNIEFAKSKKDSYILATGSIRYFFIFAEYVKNNMFIRKPDEAPKEPFIKMHGIRASNKVVEYMEITDSLNNYTITSYYKKGIIAKQTATENGDLRRDCTFDENGLATGYDTFSINKMDKYSDFYRIGKGIQIDFSDVFTRNSKFYKFIGNIANNKLNGEGKIFKNGQLISEGNYDNGKLINGKKYNVEINRKYKDQKLQDEYNRVQYFNSDEYIENSQTAEEEYYADKLENDYLYISVNADFEVIDGKDVMLQISETKVPEYDSEDII